MNNEIEQIASKVLGKTSDGSTMMRYETPDNIDPSLLVPIPRYLNRTQYDLSGDEFVGFDTWNAYEFSCLTENGFPISGLMKIVYDSSSEYIVESKSIKLYLNSFNMVKMCDSVRCAITKSEMRVSKDLSAALGSNVKVRLHIGDVDLHRPIIGDFIQLEDYVNVNKLIFNEYEESPSILVESSQKGAQAFRSYSLRSNCRVTNQPDWGDVYIYMDGPNSLSAGSLLKYIVSMRKENHFHEEICECIYKRLLDSYSPVDLFVACLYTRRGGIDINPVRANKESLIERFAYNLKDKKIACAKTLRQ